MSDKTSSAAPAAATSSQSKPQKSNKQKPMKICCVGAGKIVLIFSKI